MGVLPFEYGGGNSRLEEIYLALRRLMGNVPAAYGTIEDLWRVSKAYGLVMVLELPELAVAQSFTMWATVGLPRWEHLFGLPGEGPVQTRRDAATAHEVEPIRSDIPSLAAELEKISTKLTILDPNRDTQRVLQSGRAFGSWGDDETFSLFSMFSDAHVLRIRYELDVSETTIPSSIRARVAAALNDRLPIWDTWELVTDGPMESDGGPDGSHVTDQTICSA